MVYVFAGTWKYSRAEVRNSGNFSTVFNQNYTPISGQRCLFRWAVLPWDIWTTRHFDQTGKSLNIKIKTDKSEYRPKDKVHVEVEITDKNGRPVEARSISIWQMKPFMQYRIIYTDILGFVWRHHKFRYQEHIYNSWARILILAVPNMAARRFWRKILKMPYFWYYHRGQTWKGYSRVQVSDNLTSWRLTCQAVTSDLAAGTKTAR